MHGVGLQAVAQQLYALSAGTRKVRLLRFLHMPTASADMPSVNVSNHGHETVCVNAVTAPLRPDCSFSQDSHNVLLLGSMNVISRARCDLGHTTKCQWRALMDRVKLFA
jgi:hypothetical protein